MPWPATITTAHDAVAVSASLLQTLEDRLPAELAARSAERFAGTAVELSAPVLYWRGQRVPPEAEHDTPAIGVMISPEPDEILQESGTSIAAHLVETRFAVVCTLQQSAILATSGAGADVLTHDRWFDAVHTYGAAIRWILDEYGRRDAVESRSLPVHLVSPARLSVDSAPVIPGFDGEAVALDYGIAEAPFAVRHYIRKGRL